MKGFLAVFAFLDVFQIVGDFSVVPFLLLIVAFQCLPENFPVGVFQLLTYKDHVLGREGRVYILGVEPSVVMPQRAFSQSDRYRFTHARLLSLLSLLLVPAGTVLLLLSRVTQFHF